MAENETFPMRIKRCCDIMGVLLENKCLRSNFAEDELAELTILKGVGGIMHLEIRYCPNCREKIQLI